MKNAYYQAVQMDFSIISREFDDGEIVIRPQTSRTKSRFMGIEITSHNEFGEQKQELMGVSKVTESDAVTGMTVSATLKP